MHSQKVYTGLQAECLQEAEEESEDSSEEEIELEFDERAKISKLKVRILHTSIFYFHNSPAF